MRRITALASAVAVVAVLLSQVPAGPALAQGKEVHEPSTGVGFPVIRKWGRYTMTCIGVCLREKFSLDVYAGCFYVDQKLGKEKLLAFLATPKADGAYKDGKLDTARLLGNPEFFKWLINADLPISIDMTFVRTVSAEKIRETYEEGLSKYLQDKALIKRFTDLSQGEVTKFQHLTLNLLPGGQVVFQFANATHKPIVSSALARALLSIYFGHSPITPKIKKDLVQNIEWLLR